MRRYRPALGLAVYHYVSVVLLDYLLFLAGLLVDTNLLFLHRRLDGIDIGALALLLLNALVVRALAGIFHLHTPIPFWNL